MEMTQCIYMDLSILVPNLYLVFIMSGQLFDMHTEKTGQSYRCLLIALSWFLLNSPLHYAGQSLFRMDLMHSYTCLHCLANVPDHYLHTVWQCAPVNKFWQMVCKDLSARLGCAIPASPSLCALGDLISMSI